jgi:hypothetical protein
MFFPAFACNFSHCSYVMYSKKFNRDFHVQKIFAGNYRFAGISISTKSTTGTKPAYSRRRVAQRLPVNRTFEAVGPRPTSKHSAARLPA